jgi:hypothetical protein
VRPSLGLQTLDFIGNPPAERAISPGDDRALPFGGGLISAHPGLRLQFEAFSSESDHLRLPVSFEYFSLSGKTTFVFGITQDNRVQRLTFKHTADIITGSLGLTASFFNVPSVYVSGEVKAVQIFPTNLNRRSFIHDNDSTINSTDIQISDAKFRIGAFAKIGTQVEFFEPLLLDFNVGVGALNLLLRDTDPETGQNLLVVENQYAAPEEIVKYFSIGMTVVWKL